MSKEMMVIATEKGIVKKMVNDGKPWKSCHRGGKGSVFITLTPNDKIIAIRRLKKGDGISLTTAKGRFIWFPEYEIRPMGELAKGVRGIRLEKGDKVMTMKIIPSVNCKKQKGAK